MLKFALLPARGYPFALQVCKNFIIIIYTRFSPYIIIFCPKLKKEIIKWICNYNKRKGFIKSFTLVTKTAFFSK